ncbi:MAG: hypothetical protein LJE59_11635 [Chromatiaceae bacterium]|nr:hypothetical protein [Chromatiaceae bacterium]
MQSHAQPCPGRTADRHRSSVRGHTGL